MNDHHPSPTVPVQNWYQAQADSLYAVAIVGGLALPGALVGALLVGGLWTITKEPLPRRLLTAILGASLAILARTIVLSWPWSPLLALLTHSPTEVFPFPTIAHSLATELLFGPALFVALQTAHTMRRRTVLGRVQVERENTVRRSRAMSRGWDGDPGESRNPSDWNHPLGKIRLGIDESRRLFDLDASEVAHHIFVPGASGSGKTTTLMRIANGALKNGYSAVFIDCKGTSLTGDVRRLAQSLRLPFNVVDPDNPSTLGYDPCTGDAAHVANKLVGAFTFSGEAEIYKQVAMEVLPVIVRSLEAAGDPVSLSNIYAALRRGGLAQLGRAPGAERYKDQLLQLERSGGVGTAGYAGLQHRLGALRQGKFGPIFEKRPALDWDEITSTQSLTCFSLSATAAGEDVELVARVITQDLKQLCDARLRLIDSGQPVKPLLIMYDEFAALREAPQIVDLLLQARQARMPVVVATQYLPEEIPIRTPLMQAGVLICHRVGAEDAEALAAEFGTHQAPKLTSQVDFDSGQSEKGSIRMVEEYNVHPNTLRELRNGTAAVYAHRSNRRSLVHIHSDLP